ncbi:MAG: DUF2147 domain-containing protein [Acidobacteriota bacterium]
MLLRRISLAAALLSVLPTALMAQSTPSGLWETYDDSTGVATSHVRVSETDRTLSGSIDRILDESKATAVCAACEDERHNRPLIGMTIFRDVKASAEVPLTWEGGEILDPKNGRTYKVRIRLIDDGKVLEVRGYKGSPVFGRTQLWQRVAETTPAAAPASPAASAASASLQ